MKNAEEVEVAEEVTPSSSPPTPPSPLPISVGPGNSKYYFSSSPSASPPFSPATSADQLPLIPHLKVKPPSEEVQEEEEEIKSHSQITSAFSLSLDRRPDPPSLDSSSNSSNCLRDLLEWFVIRCCSCCTLTLSPPSKSHQS